MSLPALKTRDIISLLKNCNSTTLRCPYCLSILESIYDGKKNILYCPNEMCLNEHRYNKNSIEIE